MNFYISIGQIENEIRLYNENHNMKTGFIEILRLLHSKGEYKNELSEQPSLYSLCQSGDTEFLHNIRNLQFCFPEYILFDSEQFDVVPTTSPLTVITSFFGLQTFSHLHDCFEIDYVFSGTARLHFLDEERELKEGDLYIQSPFTKHDIVPATPESFIFTILVKEKSFNKTFLRLLKKNDIISLFFKNTFSTTNKPNYLIFRTNDSFETKDFAKRLFLETFRYDSFVIQNSINLLELLFSSILRNNSAYAQFSRYSSGPDYAPILRYIQSHYQTISLPDLAKRFNYAIPYLSKIIKESTGKNFTQLVKELRMREAVSYLIETDYSIEKISYLIGYKNSDNFTRVFHKFYDISPSKYRSIYRKSGVLTTPVTH